MAGPADKAAEYVFTNVEEGDAMGVADGLDKFCRENPDAAPYGLDRGHAAMVAKVIQDRQIAAVQCNVGAPWINVLNIGSGLGAGTLRCLPCLLENARAGSIMKVVNVEEDKHLSDVGKLLVDFALSKGKGSAAGEIDFKHHALNPAAGTPFADMMATLKELPYQVVRFDLVLLGGGVEKHQNAVETMIANRNLSRGAVFYSEVPARGDEGTEAYIKYIESTDGLVVYEVREITEPTPATVIVATVTKVKELWEI